MRISDIIGNRAAVAAISAAAEKNHHAYIISGPAGAGKSLAASVLSAALVCSASGSQKPCGMCSACKKSARGIHPDIITVMMEGKTSFLVNQAREIRNDVFILPNEAERKIYILPDAGCMQPAAQNALLKVLEEPPEYAVFILICENPSLLFETVRSRCIEIAMKPLDIRQVYDYLSAHRPEFSKAELEAAAQNSGGLIGKALAYLGGGETLAETSAREICASLADGDELAVYKAFLKLEGVPRDEIRNCFSTVLSILHDALILKTGSSALSAPPFGNISNKLCAKYTSKKLALAAKAAYSAYGRTAVFLTPGNLLAGTAAELYSALTCSELTGYTYK
jgi:DNA polymerase-3 subunit delta'